MKIWCSPNRNPANRWCESWALWSSFPVADISKLFLGKLLSRNAIAGAVRKGHSLPKNFEILGVASSGYFMNYLLRLRIWPSFLVSSGGTPIFVVSRQQFMKYPGWDGTCAFRGACPRAQNVNDNHSIGCRAVSGPIYLFSGFLLLLSELQYKLSRFDSHQVYSRTWQDSLIRRETVRLAAQFG